MRTASFFMLVFMMLEIYALFVLKEIGSLIFATIAGTFSVGLFQFEKQLRAILKCLSEDK